MLWDKKNQRCAKDKFLQLRVVFSIAAFMNSKRGTLFMGVDPHKVLVGLQNDFRCLGKNNNWDGWNLHLTNLIRDHIGNRFSTYISVRPRSKDSKTVAEIRLEKSSDPVWIT
jgi:hypothetical protein